MSHSQFHSIKCLYLDMHGLIFETSIWLLAGSTRFLSYQPAAKLEVALRILTSGWFNKRQRVFVTNGYSFTKVPTFVGCSGLQGLWWNLLTETKKLSPSLCKPKVIRSIVLVFPFAAYSPNSCTIASGLSKVRQSVKVDSHSLDYLKS